LGTIDDLRKAVGLPSVFDNSDATDREESARVYYRGSPKRRPGEGQANKCVDGDEIECFHRLVANNTLAEEMQTIYGHVDNVDPYIALVGEKHANTNTCPSNGRMKGCKNSSSVGETATLVVLNQLKKIRDGDRFWYEAKDILTRKELREIKALTLSDLLKANFPELADEIPEDALQTMQSECVKTNS
jgi:hypothetical protein